MSYTSLRKCFILWLKTLDSKVTVTWTEFAAFCMIITFKVSPENRNIVLRWFQVPNLIVFFSMREEPLSSIFSNKVFQVIELKNKRSNEVKFRIEIFDLWKKAHHSNIQGGPFDGTEMGCLDGTAVRFSAGKIACTIERSPPVFIIFKFLIPKSPHETIARTFFQHIQKAMEYTKALFKPS